MIKIKEIQDVVRDLLIKSPHLKDCDEKLVANIWHSQLLKQGKDSKIITAYDFMKLYADGKLINSESITRCRRKLQEEHPELRGVVWEKRHQKQDVVKEELGYKIYR